VAVRLRPWTSAAKDTPAWTNVVRADFTPSVEEKQAPPGESTDRQLQCDPVAMMEAADKWRLNDSAQVR
jgi:hypothetical protein